MDTPLLDAFNRVCPYYGAGSSSSVLREILLDPEVAGLIAVASSTGHDWTLDGDENHIQRASRDAELWEFKKEVDPDFRERYAPTVAYEQRSQDWESHFTSDSHEDLERRPVGITVSAGCDTVAWSNEKRKYKHLS